MLSRRRAGEPTGTRGRLGGFLPRRTQTRPAAGRRSGGRGCQREQKRSGKKERSAVADMPEEREPLAASNGPPAPAEVRPCSCLYAVWENEVMGVFRDLVRTWTTRVHDTARRDEAHELNEQGVHRARGIEMRGGGELALRRSRPAALRPPTVRRAGAAAWLKSGPAPSNADCEHLPNSVWAASRKIGRAAPLRIN